MTQTALPFLFMRGGSSRGPYMRREHLPEDLDTLAEVLIAMVGAGHPLNIDGIGWGAAVTTKVAMLSPGSDGWADVDYFFGQVSVEERQVDFKPTCGNILSAVGPAAIEMGIQGACVSRTPHLLVAK
jgi:2-methylaconitate cis-trans-isomerase PrpF